MNLKTFVILVLTIFMLGCGGGGGGDDAQITPPIDPVPVPIGPGNPIYEKFYCPNPLADDTVVTYSTYGYISFDSPYQNSDLLARKCGWTMKKISRGGNAIDTVEFLSPQMRSYRDRNCYSPKDSVRLFFDMKSQKLIRMDFNLGWCGIFNNRIRVGVTSMWSLLSSAPFFVADEENTVSYTIPGSLKVYVYYNQTTGKITQVSSRSSGYK